MPQQTDINNANSVINPEFLMLPGPDSSKDGSTKLDAADGRSVRLDELGPMVVNTTDGTLSRISNWTQMTDMERERTFRFLSARNKLRLANEERKQRKDDPGAVERMMIISSSSSSPSTCPPEANKT